MRNHIDLDALVADLITFRTTFEFTQNDIAIASDCSQSFVSRLENFVDDDHCVEYLCRICDVIERDIRQYFARY